MNLSRERQGELLIFLSTILIGISPIFISISVKNIHPMLAISFTYFFSSFYFACFLPFEKRINNLKKKVTWKYLILQFLFSIFEYSILFYALSLTSVTDIGILEIVSTLFTFIVLVAWKKESITFKALIGVIFILSGSSLILFNGSFILNLGNIIFVLSKILVPFGDYYTKKARSLISSGSTMFFRSVLSFIFLLVFYMIFIGNLDLALIYENIFYLFINGFVFFGIQKSIWVEGTYRIAITKASTILSFSPIITLFFVYVIFGTIPTLIQILALIPMIVGCLLIIRRNEQGFIVNETFE